MSLLTGLSAYWKLDGNGNDTVASWNPSSTAASWVTGLINQAASFNGSQGIQYADNAVLSFGSSDFAIQAWIKLGTTGTTKYILGQEDAGGTNSGESIDLNINSTGKIGFNAISATNTNVVFSALSTGTITDTTTFHHLIAQRNGGNLQIYIDGSADGTTVINTAVNDPATTFSIGQVGAYGSNRFNGIIDEVGIWSRSLTNGEISQLYNGGAGLAYPFTLPSNGNFFAFF